MPIALAPAFLQTLANATKTWQMSFASVHFLLFLPLAVGGYFVLRGTLRKVWLLLASYWFYFFAAPQYLVVLLCGTLVSWLLGLFISFARPGRGKSARLVFSVALLVLGLCFFKYNGFFAGVLSPLFQALGLSYSGEFFVAAKAMGISFYTFTAIGYLIDTARGDAPAEKNLLDYALFLGFFPSITSGPISRAGGLLPQLKDTSRSFNAASAADALRQAGWGFFKKLAVANTLAVFVNYVYSPAQLDSCSGLILILANIAFVLQLYFDFSGYTDIALAAAKLLGIQLPQNFNLPFFATNFSGFWQRWHMSLSTWLQDYIFTPLVWSRWTEKLPFIGKRVSKPPVLSSLALVFLISGLWHGDTLCYLVWGALQAAFRIGEELLHRGIGKPKKNPAPLVKAAKTWVVRLLWMQSLVFFKVGLMQGLGPAEGLGTAVRAVLRQLPGFALPGGFSILDTWFAIYNAIYYGVYSKSIVVYGFLLFALICLAAACLAERWQYKRVGQAGFASSLGGFKAPVRWVWYYFIVICCFGAFLFQSGGYGGASFIYGGF